MKKNKFIHLIPFLIICFIMVYTWYLIISENRYILYEQTIGLALFCINVIVYFFRFKWGVITTGIILLIVTSDYVSFFPEISSTSFSIGTGETKISTPHIQLKSLLLVVIYLVFNFTFLYSVFYPDPNHIKTIR
jgi:hypothetical protein